MSTTPLANLQTVSLTPVVHLDLRISPRIFEKILNGPNGILWGWGEIATSFPCAVDTGGKFATGVNDTATMPVANNENNVRLQTP